MLSDKYTCKQARAKLAELCDQVTSERDFIVITRKNAESVALIPLGELTSILETIYLLRSPKNADRLLKALNRAKSNTVKPKSLDDLCNELNTKF
ncbi:MAG TPA: type II toxin-antitoxin system Phd/YefM family antitoxin [Nostocaceae cyanobacterium]|nr:type II toxin-antitoxin system Phd/YefM family antitoxin [Nostocaceae cyanobacterium]